LVISKASVHNLKGFDLSIPAGGIVVVTGVSGSGKSSLVFDLIHASALRGEAAGCAEIKGLDQFSRIIAVEQKTVFTAGNAILATYAGLLDPIRGILAKEPAAVTMGMGRNHFSFLNKQGMCPHCDGHGFITTSMDFLPDVVSPCEFCKGARYAEEVLTVMYQGKNISGMLDLTVSEAIDFFAGNQKLTAHLDLLAKIGLEYLKLGQRLTTLSGGEVQRLQLAIEMMKPANGPSLYLFDEPSTGLHFFDIRKLLEAFSGLANLGHTLLIIEHDPAIIAFAGHVVELGPDGGDAGGYLISSSSRSR
jgi:excinuclease ABC subunit A